MKKNKILTIPIILNAILFLYLLFFIYRTQELKNSHNNDASGEGYSYLNNSQYEAYRSMFHLSKRDDTRVVFLGDSITARGCFEEFFEEKSIVNRGIGSDVTEGIFNRVEEIISLNPEQVFIMAGINDISVGVEPEKSADFMRKTCEKIHIKLPDTEIYIESILPTKNVEWKEKIKELNKLYKTICEEDGYVYVDIYSEFFFEEKLNTDLFGDDIHLDGAGYQIWIDKIEGFIDR